VAGYDRLETRRSRIKIQSFELVHYVQKACPDLENLGGWQGSGPRTLVIITSDRRDWSDLRKTIQNFGRANITCVNDEIGSRERVDCLGSEETVGVRDYADCAPHLAVYGSALSCES
jgi:hypothetical protein